MIIRVGIAGKIGFRLTDFDSDFFVGGLDEGEVILNCSLHLREVPHPAAVAALKEDAAVVDGKRIDQLQRQMFVEDEDVAEVAIAGDMVDLPEFTVAARDKRARFN